MPTRIGAVVPTAQATLATGASPAPATASARPIAGTGVTSPELLAFRRRLEPLLARAIEHLPHAHVERLRTPLIACVLQDRQLLGVSDRDLLAFLRYAAVMSLQTGKELAPVVDVHPTTSEAVLAWVESVAGVQRLMREAGARHVQSGTVYAADTFRCNVGEGRRDFAHVAPAEGIDRGSVVAYYALGDFGQGDWAASVVTSVQLIERRQHARLPEHRIWRDYRDRLGETQALWSLAGLMELGHPQRPGTLYPVSLEPVRPEPEPTPAPASAAPDADLTRQLMALRAARARKLPGDASVFDGHGGKPLREVPSGILRGVRLWLQADPARATTYAKLKHDITLVLQARRDRAARAASSPENTRA